ncbi:LysM peptidoglycan-binding domain-containing protein [Trinickia dinghuensis]|uniref:LysM peptidoglycan-binding domain-containing protein n=2 Tax=Trinickia dinghuensis TaxID=2291023 RepID=A0A3D8K397_9BURK|nr:LysM peptidoglycan-binding domain-containing protein [Trinickia dinghuensis]
MFLGGCATGGWMGQSPFESQSQSSQPARVPAGFYRVNPGDTLPGIAAAFGQRVDDLAAWNNLPRTAMLTPGQILRVAPQPGVNPASNEGLVVRPAWPAYGQVTRVTDAGSNNVKGIVILGRPEEAVKASADGSVIYVGTGVDQYKSLVVVKHGGDVVTGYAVNGDVLVKEGDTVKKGQPIAQMGADSSGRGTVEFEIRRAGKPVDPLAYLPR